MIKLMKYLKPFILSLILTIVLLFVQAVCDLNLPNLMSGMVNVGIQQSGIEQAVPAAISQDGMTLIQTFMSSDECSRIEDAYSLVSVLEHDENGIPYATTYPKAANSLHILKSALPREKIDMLETAFDNASSALFHTLQQGISTQPVNAVEQMAESASDTATAIDLRQLYTLQPMLDMLPESVIEQVRTQPDSNALMRRQSGIQLIKAFYLELGADLNAMQNAYILHRGLLMLLVAFGSGIATILVSLFSTRIAAGFARNLREGIFSKVENFSNCEFDKFSTASLITRCTNDVTQVQQLLTFGIRMICYAPIMGIGGVVMAISKSVSMSWTIAVAVLILFGLIIVIMTIALPRFKIIQQLIDKLNLISRENLTGMMVIRAFGTQEFEQQRFDTANRELSSMNLFINRIMVFMMPAMTIIMNGVSLLILWVGAHNIANSAMQVGDMMAFMQYAIQIIMSFLMLSMMFIMVPRTAVSAGRIAEVLDTKISILDPVEPTAFIASQKGVIEFKNVSFRYHGAEEDTLSEITFTANPGQTTAIIGSTGSGKSTIISLILRFYDVSNGQVLVDGVDVRNVLQKDLRGKIGFIPQKGVLLSGTIASNLKYGKKNASDQEVQKAAAVAQAMDFIGEKPEAFSYPIAQGGSNVSGGQKQRLSIARALVKNPEILIFDDSFSALDFKTDAMLRKALKKHTAEVTQIIVAQRVGTIMNAEQILVLDQGKIVGCGTHKELLEKCPAYYEIASSQLSKEELS